MPGSGNVAAARASWDVEVGFAWGCHCRRGPATPANVGQWRYGTEPGRVLRQIPAMVGVVAYRCSLRYLETFHKFWLYLEKKAIIKINKKRN